MFQGDTLCQNLLQIKAIKLSSQKPFTWASGLRSPIYCDNRITLSYPKVRNLIKEGLQSLVLQHFPEANMVAGVATAGIAHGALLADAMDLPFCYVRSEAKSHGRQNQIEGEIAPNAKIIVVEDLISTGGSSLQVVDILRLLPNTTVLGVVAIFDYNFATTKDRFSQHQCDYKTLTDYQTLIEVAKNTQYINDDELQTLSTWNIDPKAWSDQII